MARRLPAEWEKQDAVLMAFPHEATDWAEDLRSALTPFVRIASAVAWDQPLVLLCRDQESVKPHFCDTRNITFLELPYNDTWTRDYGPVTVYEEGRRKFLDFTFNGWGGKFTANLDNAVTETLVKKGYLFGEYEKIDFVLEGGSIESDGQGTLLTTARCLLHPNRNPSYTQAQIETLLKEKLGVQRILWLEEGELLGDDTDAHIDTLARFVDTQTIAHVTCDDPNDPHYERLGRMREQIKSFRTQENRPYRLVPLPLPAPKYDKKGNRLPATYANYLVTNKAVLLPTYDDPKDKEMVALFQTLYPGREIIPINCLPLIRQGGSLHCSTMQIPAYYEG